LPDVVGFLMVFSSREEEHVPRAKAQIYGGFKVRDKSRTYLRSKNKSKSKNRSKSKNSAGHQLH
jgi:hypothetical protein